MDRQETGGMSWPELGISLYDRLTGRNAVITYEFEDMSVWVPDRTGEGADHARWMLDGTLHITTGEQERGR